MRQVTGRVTAILAALAFGLAVFIATPINADAVRAAQIQLADARQDAAFQVLKEAVKLYKADDLEAALESFKLGLEIDANNAAGHFWMAKTLTAMKRDDEAMGHYIKAAKLGPNTKEGIIAAAIVKRAARSGGVYSIVRNDLVSKGQDIFSDCEVCPLMKRIPSGSFMMGSSAGDADELPWHRVEIGSPFAMAIAEVTFAEFDACVTGGGCEHRPDDEGWGRGARPVVNVSWEDAREYVAWLSRKTGHRYRLPSEAEWEYAARAGTTTKYRWGDEIGRNNAVCNGCGSQWDNKKTAPVGTFAPNGFGLYDMHGNVWEWTEDCYNKSYVGAPADGLAWTTGDCSLRVARGGSWDFDPWDVRAAFRDRYTSGFRDSSFGFRVARTN